KGDSMKTSVLILACFACSISLAQAPDEKLIGEGFEPSVITNRATVGTIQVGAVISWMGYMNTIYRVYSVDQGSSFSSPPDVVNPPNATSQADATMAANTINHNFYYGWQDN